MAMPQLLSLSPDASIPSPLFNNEDPLDGLLHGLFHMEKPPPQNAYISLLKQCNKRKSLKHAKHVYEHMTSHSVKPSDFLADYIVVSFATCGSVVDALDLFYKLPCRSVFSWTSIISSFVASGEAQEGLNMYERMLTEGVPPNQYTFVCVFKACGIILDVERGQRLHIEAYKKGFGADTFVGNTLVSMYGKWGYISDAENVFQGLLKRDVVSWNAMLCTYVENGFVRKAILLYRQMQEEKVESNQYTFSILLQACSIFSQSEEEVVVEEPAKKKDEKEIEAKVKTKEAFEKVPCILGQALHADLRKKAFGSENIVGTALVGMYSECGDVVGAENAFRCLKEHDVVSWTAMQVVYIKQGHGIEALWIYLKMQHEGIYPNQHTIAAGLRACAHIVDMDEKIFVQGEESNKMIAFFIGKALHVFACEQGLAANLLVNNALITLYGKCGAIEEAEAVFSCASEHDVALWNAMLSAYLGQDQAEKALLLCKKMIEKDEISKDELTFSLLIRACGDLAKKEIGSVPKDRLFKLMPLEMGFTLHNEACLKDLASEVLVGNTLISMYGKCGAMIEAEYVFNDLSQRDSVSWNAMLSAYGERGQYTESLRLYTRMQKEGVCPTDITLLCILQACGETGNLELCKRTHYIVISSGLDLNLSLVNILIHAYASCGSMLDAQNVLDGLPQPIVVSWNACLCGYAGEGNFVEIMKILDSMQMAGLKPDEVTFTSVLSACNHTGLLSMALKIFESMTNDYCISPNVTHYGSIMDLLGRAGDFETIKKVITGGMSQHADLTLWLSLLVACQIHGNLELGKEIFHHVIGMHPDETPAYILMSNIYADTGYRKEA